MFGYQLVTIPRVLLRGYPSSCPRLSRASTTCLAVKEGVDGRDEPGHDVARLVSGPQQSVFLRQQLERPLRPGAEVRKHFRSRQRAEPRRVGVAGSTSKP